MRFHLVSIERARRAARDLRRELKSLGRDRTLSDCQAAVAAALGYPSWAELKRETARRHAPSPLDGDLPVADAAVRLAAQGRSLAAALGVPDGEGHSLALALGMTASRLSGPVGGGGVPPDRFGACLFDDPESPGAGWASVAGGVRRVAGPHALAAGVLWLTNAPFETFFQRTGLWRLPNLRHDGYLGVRPKDMVLEWGPPERGAAAARTVGTLFRRVMDRALALVRAVEPEARPEEVFRGRTLREDLRRLLPGAELPHDEAATIMRPWTARQEFTVTAVRTRKGGRLIVLRRPRLDHAAKMLAVPVPLGPFEYLPRNRLRDAAAAPARWLSETDRPCMAEVRVDSVAPEAAAILGLGVAAERDARVHRSWVAHPESLLLAEHADVEVRAAYVGSGHGVLAESLPGPVRDFLADPHAALSWSAGVVAEALWRAATLPEPAPDAEAPRVSWRGAWIKAADRASMFADALGVAGKGHDVVSYGQGWVRVSTTDEALPGLIRDACALGLLPRPADLHDAPAAADAAVWGGEERSRPFARALLAGSRDQLRRFDGPGAEERR